MVKKTHVLALTVATAGLLGFAAPLASAATMDGPASLVNIGHNQVPIQACGNNADINAVGAQTPVQGAALVGSLLSPGAVTKSTAVSNRGCSMVNNQTNKGGDPSGATLVNVDGNQIPIQACGNDVLTNTGVAQAPLEGLSGALSLLSPAAITKSTAVSNRGCDLVNNQTNKNVKHVEHDKHW